MELSGSYFTYSGTMSRKYNLIFANVKTERMVKMVGATKTNTVFNKGGNQNFFIGESFEDSPIQFEAEITTDDGQPIPVHKRREIEKWLFHQNDYRRLYADMECDTYGEAFEMVDGRQKRLYLNCRLINPERLDYNGGTIGYKFTVECDSCMAWQDEVEYTYNVGHISSTTSSIITVPVDTDLNDFIYPKVTIVMGSYGGDITISNNSDDSSRLTSFIGLKENTSVTMKGNGVNYISGDNFLKFSDKNFIRLVDGENKLTIMGNVDSITFSFQNRRYL